MNLTKAGLIFLLPACLIGCAHENSVRLADSTLALVTEYETELDRKVTAEQVFYRSQRSAIAQHYGVEEIFPGSEEDDRPLFERQPLVFLNVRSVYEVYPLQQLSGEFDSDAVLTNGELRAIMAETVRRAMAEIAAVQARQNALTILTNERIQKLSVQREALGQLRRQLVTLSTTPDAWDRAEEVTAILEQLQSTNVASATPTP